MPTVQANLLAAPTSHLENQDAVVKILLAGGHQYAIALKGDTPLLRRFLGAVLSRVQSSLCFTHELNRP